jgi:acetylornithine deacetylase/succinyl-diaminopimelate desuccinylase-like protein
MPESTQALNYARAHHTEYLRELKEFLSIPSVSTLSEYIPDMRRAAEWVCGQMRRMGLQNVEMMPTARHPVAYGEWLNAPGKPTVLVYGHYDVQPPDPLNEWTTPPFEGTVRGDDLYARGASDMKGEVHACFKALEALLRSGPLPVNVKVMIEGEEEIGSPSLAPFMQQHKDKLKCDVCLNPDVSILRPDMPSLVYGLRGLAYFELWVYGPSHDLHSGVFGGSVHNPAIVLAELIAGMHDKQGRITLPGFYDKVRESSAQELAELVHDGGNDENWKQLAGAPELYGEAGYSTAARLGVRPTLDVCGLLSGFIGEGAKTVLPAKAMAKISMRLVPYQDDQAVEEQLKEYLRRNAPPTVRWEVKSFSSGPAVLVKRSAPGIQAAVEALEATFGVKPVFKLEGGSVPVAGLVQDLLGAESILMGFGLPDDNLHSPNEKFHLPNYYRGIETFIIFFDKMGQQKA